MFKASELDLLWAVNGWAVSCRKEIVSQTHLLEGLPKSPVPAPHPGKSSSSLAVTRGKGNSYGQVHHGFVCENVDAYLRYHSTPLEETITKCF